MPQLKIKKLNYTIPLMAITGIGAIGGVMVGVDSDYDASATNSEQVTASVSYGDYYLSLSTGSEINFDLEATATGVYSYAADDVVVATNAPGYDLSISSSDNSNAGLKLNGTETTTNKIINASSATGGTSGTTAVLSANTYGYAVPSGIIGNNNFDSSYDNPSASSKWAGVPVSGSSTYGKIRSTTVATSSTGDEIDVHYGVYVNNALVAGDYTGTIVYTAVANAPAEMAASINPTSGYAGSTMTVTSGPLVANTATLANSDVSITIGDSACTVTNVDASNGYLVTTCTTSSSLTAGVKDVAISVPRYDYSTAISGGYMIKAPDLSTITSMQDGMVATRCADSDETTSIDDVHTYELTDVRNLQKYYIRKFTFGDNQYCMMVENLYLEGNTTLTSSDSNITASYTLPASVDKFTQYSTAYVNNGARFRVEKSNRDGSYYSFTAARAGQSNTGTTDICPKGWRLPTKAELGAIAQTSSGVYSVNKDSTLFANAQGGVRSAIFPGYYANNGIQRRGVTDYDSLAWMSNTRFNEYAVWRLQYFDSRLLVTNGMNDYYGSQVRCLVQVVS